MPTLLHRMTDDPGKQSPMLRSLIRVLVLSFLGSSLMSLMPAVLNLQSLYLFGLSVTLGFLLKVTILFGAAVIVTVAFYYSLRILAVRIDSNMIEQVQFLDRLEPKYVDIAILCSAALSLVFELAIIRWQASVFEFFAFYKNFSLLACFMGLGLGYALATRDRIPLLLTLPLLAWQFGFMVVIRSRYGDALRVLPFREQLNMGVGGAPPTWQIGTLYTLLTIVFVLTALSFMPIGQLCGRLMERRPKLRAYGLNLLGSLLGVLVMLLASFLWTPPIVWFSFCFVPILLFHLRNSFSLIIGVVSMAVCTAILAWPVNPLSQRVYSPYQFLEIGHDRDTGLSLINAAGHYYQRIFDLSSGQLNPKLVRTREYYDFPYKAHPKLSDIAVVGAGTGNDVAAALRAGASYVDAIEIDPAILLIGRQNHPEKPYDDARVHAQINDARSFLRTTNHQYDLIVYGLLDSHTLLSQGSSVRLDSFVYTVEGLREARNRLKPDGVISLSFSVFSPALGRKIYLMMEQVFDGRPPICVMAVYDLSIIFLESNSKNWSLPSALLQETGFADRTSVYADRALQADVSTDDWPFFYMPRRVYPTSYLVIVLQILVLSFLITGNFFAERPKFSNLSFFFLGAGFMLIETKGITEMGLTFGNTWQVIGFMIAGILIMAWLGNCAVEWLKIKRPLVPYLFLWATLAVGWFIARSGGFPSTLSGRLETAVVLTCPLFFSGIIFSTLLSTKGEISGIMAMNLLGAICGGLVEYNSMYFGFHSLYVIAMSCYFLAFASDFISIRNEVREKVLATSRASSDVT